MITSEYFKNTGETMSYKVPDHVVARMKYMRFVERKTLQEIADSYGISRQRVFQIVGKSGFIADVADRYQVREQKADYSA